MRRLLRSTVIPVGLVLLVLPLAGCQRVSDSRAEFCQALRDVSTSAIELKTAKIDQPMDQVKATADRLQQRRQNLDRLATQTSVPSVVKLDAAVDSAVQAVNEVAGSTLGPAVAKVNAAGDQVQQAYTEVYDAACSAK